MPLVAVPAPYDFELSTERYRAFGRDHANVFEDGALYRVVAGREVRIVAAPGGVEVEPWNDAVGRDVRRLLGLAHDLDGFRALAAADPVLEPLEERLRGFRPTLVPDSFEMLVGAIAAQQVSLFAATAVKNRFVERFGERGEHAWAFPPAARVAAAPPGELVALGFSRRKAEYVLGVAGAAGELGELDGQPDEEVAARLTALRGLGEWTADWFLARHLGRPRAWPAGDLGLRKAVAAFYGPVEDVRGFGARFAPFESLAAHYLLLGLRSP